MANKKYWQSFSDLADREEQKKRDADEFKEDLPVDSNGIDTSSTRRDFLKYVGFSTAAAAVAASAAERRLLPAARRIQERHRTAIAARSETR